MVRQEADRTVTDVELAPSRDVAVVREYLRARAAVERCDRLAKKRKERLDAAKTKVLGLYESEGIASVRVDGTLVSLTRTLRANITLDNMDEAARLFREHGLDDLVGVRINAQTLSSWVRERDRDDETLPDDLAAIITVYEDFNLSARKS